MRAAITGLVAMFLPQRGEIAEAGFQFGEPLSHERADAPTRGAATLTLRQGRRQIAKREANRERSAH